MGDNVYEPSHAKAVVIVNKIPTSLLANNISLIYNNPADLAITIKDIRGNVLVGKDISIIVNLTKDSTVNVSKTTNELGMVSLSIDYNAGSYISDINFKGDEIYVPSSATCNIKISKSATQIYAPNVVATYGDGSKFVITLKDENGNELVGKNITLALNGKFYSKRTDANGELILNINLAFGKYFADISFTGDDNYKPSNHTSKILVYRATPKLIASSKAFKANAKNKKVSVALKNYNNPIKNVIVKLTVNKKTYKVRTNLKGVATFNVNFLTKKGTYNAVYQFSGYSNYKTVSKKVRIVIK